MREALIMTPLVRDTLRDPYASGSALRSAVDYQSRIRCALAWLDDALVARHFEWKHRAFQSFRIAKQHARSAVVSRRECETSRRFSLERRA